MGAALLLILPLPGAAQQPGAPRFSGSGQIGVSARSTSTSYFSLVGDHTLYYRKGALTFDLRTLYRHSESTFEGYSPGPGGVFVQKKQSVRSNAGEAQGHIRGKFTGRNYWLLLGSWDRDPSQGIAHRENAAGGVGRDVLFTKRGGLVQIELAGGYLNERQNDTLRFHYPTVGSALNLVAPVGAGGRVSSNNSWLGDTGGRNDWVFRSRNTVYARLTRVFGLSVTFTASHDNKPSLAFFDPTGEGEVTMAASKRTTDLAAALSIRW